YAWRKSPRRNEKGASWRQESQTPAGSESCRHDPAGWERPSLREREEPDVAEVNGVAVVLQVQLAGRGLLLEAEPGGARDGGVIVDGHAIVLQGEDGVGGLLAGAVEAGGPELEVVGLPGQGWETEVEAGGRVLVDGRTIVLLRVEAEAVEDLHLVAALEV